MASRGRKPMCAKLDPQANIYGSQILNHEPNKLVGRFEIRSHGLTPTARLELSIPIEGFKASSRGRGRVLQIRNSSAVEVRTCGSRDPLQSAKVYTKFCNTLAKCSTPLRHTINSPWVTRAERDLAAATSLPTVLNLTAQQLGWCC